MQVKYYVDCNGIICNTENPPEGCYHLMRTEGDSSPYEVVDVVDIFHNEVIDTYVLWDIECLCNTLKKLFVC